MTMILLFLMIVFGLSSCAHGDKKLMGHCDHVNSSDDLNACDPYPSGK